MPTVSELTRALDELTETLYGEIETYGLREERISRTETAEDRRQNRRLARLEAIRRRECKRWGEIQSSK